MTLLLCICQTTERLTNSMLCNIENLAEFRDIWTLFSNFGSDLPGNGSGSMTSVLLHGHQKSNPKKSRSDPFEKCGSRSNDLQKKMGFGSSTLILIFCSWIGVSAAGSGTKKNLDPFFSFSKADSDPKTQLDPKPKRWFLPSEFSVKD